MKDLIKIFILVVLSFNFSSRAFATVEVTPKLSVSEVKVANKIFGDLFVGRADLKSPVISKNIESGETILSVLDSARNLYSFDLTTGKHLHTVDINSKPNTAAQKIYNFSGKVIAIDWNHIIVVDQFSGKTLVDHMIDFPNPTIVEKITVKKSNVFLLEVLEVIKNKGMSDEVKRYEFDLSTLNLKPLAGVFNDIKGLFSNKMLLKGKNFKNYNPTSYGVNGYFYGIKQSVQENLSKISLPAVFTNGLGAFVDSKHENILITNETNGKNLVKMKYKEIKDQMGIDKDTRTLISPIAVGKNYVITRKISNGGLIGWFHHESSPMHLVSTESYLLNRCQRAFKF